MKKKQCIECKKRKPLMEFYKRKDSEDGLMNQCRECKAKRKGTRHVK